MAAWAKLVSELILADGKIEEGEITILKKYLKAEGKYDQEALDFLATLRSGAHKKGISLDALDSAFLDIVGKSVIGEDKKISDEHSDYLSKHIGAKSNFDETKRKEFYGKLKKGATGGGDKFGALYDKLYPAPKEEKKDDGAASGGEKKASSEKKSGGEKKSKSEAGKEGGKAKSAKSSGGKAKSTKSKKSDDDDADE